MSYHFFFYTRSQFLSDDIYNANKVGLTLGVGHPKMMTQLPWQVLTWVPILNIVGTIKYLTLNNDETSQNTQLSASNE